jgi:hypothetical protein
MSSTGAAASFDVARLVGLDQVLDRGVDRVELHDVGLERLVGQDIGLGRLVLQQLVLGGLGGGGLALVDARLLVGAAT